MPLINPILPYVNLNFSNPQVKNRFESINYNKMNSLVVINPKTQRYILKRCQILFLSLFIPIFGGLFGQGEISTVIPNSGISGQSMNVMIRAINTNFNRQTTVNFGTGIRVNQITANDNLTLTVSINIEATAPLGPRKIVVQTNNSKIEGDFDVIGVGNKLSAQIEVYPVQSVSVSDFDKNNIQSAPLLFNVRVFNDNQVRNLRAEMFLYCTQYGLLGTAERSLPNVQPNQILSFNNKEFQKYDVSKANKTFIQQVITTGSLPPDDYNYKIILFDDKGRQVAETEGVNTITNQATGLNLISPGVPVNENPEIIYNKFPQFQWFSQANSFDISLWKCDKNAIIPNDITSRLPMFKQENISGNQLIYPISARILEDGGTYAWQITGYINSSRGRKVIKSEVFWFSLGSTDKKYSKVSKMDVIPGETTMGVGDTLTFRTVATNEKSESITIKPIWKVVPADGGHITQEGKFKALKPGKTVAVIANYAGMQEYATVKIVQSLSNDCNFDEFFRKVFGVKESK